MWPLLAHVFEKSNKLSCFPRFAVESRDPEKEVWILQESTMPPFNPLPAVIAGVAAALPGRLD
jgi:hypothetical protein